MQTTTINVRWMKIMVMLAFACTAGIAAAQGDSSPSSETRVSESAYRANAGRDRPAPDRISTDAFDAAAAEGDRRDSTRAGERQKFSVDNSYTPNTDFWFYTVDVSLFADRDNDGYYNGIDLMFDADTYYSIADVYAVVYLSLEGGAWTEYASTDTFSIHGASADDEYVIVTELLAGYPSGSYEILIELFDAWDDSFVADIGPESTSELAYLSLEDSERDAPLIGPQVVTISQGGGGAADWLALIVLGLLAAVTARVRGPARSRQPATARQRRRGPCA